MSGPRWDDEMKFELFRLKSELRSENFRVLATPLGLGRIKADPSQARRPERSLYPTLTKSSAEPLSGPSTQPSPEALFPRPQRPVSRAVPVKLNMDSPRRTLTHESEEIDLSALASPLMVDERPHFGFKLSHFLLAHLLDLSFVGLCLGLGFVVLVLILDPSHLSLGPEGLLESVPMQVLQRLEIWAIALGVYTVFGLYWLFFKLVSGSTLGESCVNNFRQRDLEMAAAPGNASTES